MRRLFFRGLLSFILGALTGVIIYGLVHHLTKPSHAHSSHSL